MAITYEPIATTTLGSSGTTSTITFSSIPSTYTDLILICTGNASASVTAKLQFNNDTASNYSVTYVQGDGTNATSFRETDKIYGGSFYNTTTPTVTIINVMNYTNTTTYKTVLNRTNYSASFVNAAVGLWRKTPEAINRLDLSIGANTFNAGFTATLYGVKAA